MPEMSRITQKDARKLARQFHHAAHYGKFRLGIIERVIAGHMTPRQVADQLEQHLDMFPAQALALRSEIDQLRAGRRWSDLPPIRQGEVEEGLRIMEASHLRRRPAPVASNPERKGIQI